MNQKQSDALSRITIIWIDDNPDPDIRNDFYDAGIDTKTFTKAEEALDEYKTHRGTYQAIIFDLQGEDGTTIEFSKAVKAFEEIIKKDIIPYYVLTNYNTDDQPFKEARGTIAAFEIKDSLFYHKSAHIPLLINDIKKDVLGSERFRIRKKYEEAFEAFESGILDEKWQESLYKIVECVSDKSEDYTGLFNDMRQIYEMILHRFVELKLPSQYYYGLKDNGQLSFSNDTPRESKRNVKDYLSGNEINVGIAGTNFKTKIQIKDGRVLSFFMMDILDRLFYVLNDNSHYNPGKNWAKEPELREEIPHFFESTALLMIDLVIWAGKMLGKDNVIYKEKRITPEDQAMSTSPVTIPVITDTPARNPRKLKEDETRIVVKVRPNFKYPDRPIVNSIEGPNVYFRYGKYDFSELVNKLMENPNEQRVIAVVKRAHEIVEFEL